MQWVYEELPPCVMEVTLSHLGHITLNEALRQLQTDEVYPSDAAMSGKWKSFMLNF